MQTERIYILFASGLMLIGVSTSDRWDSFAISCSNYEVSALTNSRKKRRTLKQRWRVALKRSAVVAAAGGSAAMKPGDDDP